jgi:hypothetical protein
MIGMKLQDVELVVANQFIMVVPIPISHSQAQIRYKHVQTTKKVSGGHEIF